MMTGAPKINKVKKGYDEAPSPIKKSITAGCLSQRIRKITTSKDHKEISGSGRFASKSAFKKCEDP